MSPAAAWAWTWFARGSKACAALSKSRASPGEGTQRHAAPAADHGHHRRPAGGRGRCLLRAAAGHHPRMHRTDARGHCPRQRQAHRQRARRAGALHPAARALRHAIAAGPEIEQIMLVETAEGRFGFVVDQVLGNCQTVIKSLGRFYRQVQVVSGATILGNGSVALILDPERLIQDAVREEKRGKGGRAAQVRGEPQQNSVDFTALVGKAALDRAPVHVCRQFNRKCFLLLRSRNGRPIAGRRKDHGSSRERSREEERIPWEQQW